MVNLRIKRTTVIMKSVMQAKKVTKDSAFIMTRATEMFIKSLTKQIYEDFKVKNTSKVIKYDNVVEVVRANNKYEFLDIIIPKKITVKRFKKLYLNKEKENKESNDEIESSGEDEENLAKTVKA